MQQGEADLTSASIWFNYIYEARAEIKEIFQWSFEKLKFLNDLQRGIPNVDVHSISLKLTLDCYSIVYMVVRSMRSCKHYKRNKLSSQSRLFIFPFMDYFNWILQFITSTICVMSLIPLFSLN